jgi:nicotinate-nucleotide pyrophosphorylase (carboxylating)
VDLMEEPMKPESDLMVVDRALARLAVLEDVGDGDLTAALIPGDARAVAVVRAREPGILSGLGVATEVFNVIDPGVEVEVHCEGGAPFAEGETILRASGATRSLLTAERSVLNFLQHLSGIATLTARFVKEVEGTAARITDTRKTTPGLRLLEKTAVLDGGGVNHRLGLYDAVMIKDNHIDAMRGVAQAIAAARGAAPGAPIIVEARDIEEARVAAEMGVGRILLDNMMPEMVEICVGVIRAIERRIAPAQDMSRWIPGTWRPGDAPIQIEVSGGITLETARSYALPGVDFLAVGALTHSAAALDIAMDLEAVRG